MALVIVDASVVVKWYIPEKDHEVARALRDDYLSGTHDLLAPAVMPFEVLNALKYSGQYDNRENLTDASESLSSYGIRLVSFVECGPVAEVSAVIGETVYDAAYVALAASRDATVYTADGRLLKAVTDSPYEGRVSHLRDYE